MDVGDRNPTGPEKRPQASESQRDDVRGPSPGGRAYASPVLSSYGTVRDITRGNTGGDPEPIVGETSGGT